MGKNDRANTAATAEYYAANPQAYNPNEPVAMRAIKIAKSQLPLVSAMGGLGIHGTCRDYCDGFIDTEGNFHGVPPFSHEQANMRLEMVMADDEYEFFYKNWVKVSRTMGGLPAAYLGQDGSDKKVLPPKQKIGIQKWLKDSIRDQDWVEMEIFSWGIAENNDGKVRFKKGD